MLFNSIQFNSKKHKLMLYKTQSGEPNYVDHKFELAT